MLNLILISLGISLLAYIFFWLSIARMIAIYKDAKENKNAKLSKLPLIYHVRILILILIPILNIAMFIVYFAMFCFDAEEDLKTQILKKIEEV